MEASHRHKHSLYWLLLAVLMLCTLSQTRPSWPVKEELGIASGARITGRVIDSNGAPLAASVSIEHLPSEKQQQSTGALFAFLDLPLGDYLLTASAPGKASQQLTVSLDPTHATPRIVFRLGDAVRIAGSVRDSSGLPVANAEVSAFCQQEHRLLFPNQVTRSDATGSFSFLGLSAGAWQLEARRDSNSPSAQLVVSAPQDNVSLILPEGQGISGVLVDAGTGQPLPLAKVMLGGSGIWPTRSTSTDTTGRFAFFALPDGVYSLSATAIRADGVPMASLPEEGILLSSGLPAPSLTLAAEEAFLLSGELYGPSAELLPGALVQISQDSSYTVAQEVITDTEGRFVFEAVPPGEVYLRVLANELPPAPPIRLFVSERMIQDGPPTQSQEETAIARASANPLSTVVVEDKILPVAIFLPLLYPIVGEVRDESGAPIRGAWLTVQSRSGELLAEAGLRQGQLRFANEQYGTSFEASGVFSSDAGGNFQLSVYEPTEVVVVAQAEGYASSAATCRSQTPCKLSLDLARSLRVRVVDLDNKPIPEARGRTFQGDSATTECLQEGGGYLRCEPVGRETSLLVRAKGYTSVTKTGLRGDGPVETVVLLPNDAIIAGYVVDAKGFPVEGAEIDILIGETLVQTSSSVDGTFSAENLPRAEADIRVTAEGYAALQTRASGEDIELVLREGGSLVGEVEDERGVPIEWAQVEIVGIAGLVAQDGSFRLESLPAGQHELRVSASGYAESTLSITVENGETTEAVVVLYPAGLLQLRVRRSDGTAAVGAEVLLLSEKGERVLLQTDSSGAVSKAGLREGTWQVVLQLAEEGARERVVLRARETTSLEITLQEGEGELRMQREGITFLLRLSTLTIGSVESGSEAEAAGVRSGDEVLSANNRVITEIGREEIVLLLQESPLTLQLRTRTGKIFGVEIVNE